MKRRTEDQILLLAYGELEPAEAEALTKRLEADPALRALYEEHMRVRKATRAVPPPPAPSLSHERLRERILCESVPRGAAGWGWAFAGGGVALAAVLGILSANLPLSVRDDRVSTPRPDLTVALTDLPAPHEWVPSLIRDIPKEQPTVAPSNEPSPSRRNTAPHARAAGKSAETAVTQPGKDAAKGAVRGDEAIQEEPTVVVVGANGRAVELEGTGGVSFGG